MLIRTSADLLRLRVSYKSLLFHQRSLVRLECDPKSTPLTEISLRSIAEAGETGILFLEKMIASAPAKQEGSWLNVSSSLCLRPMVNGRGLTLMTFSQPFAYSLPTWTVTPPPEDAQAEEDQSQPLLKAEEEEGPWGESTAPKEIAPFSGKRLALVLIVFALVVGGVVTGLVLWSQHNYSPDPATKA